MMSLSSEFSMLESYLLNNTYQYDILNVETTNISVQKDFREIRCQVREYEVGREPLEYSLYLRNGSLYNEFGKLLRTIYEE